MGERFGIIAHSAKEGIVANNPILVQAIGLCPALATTTTAQNGLGMGLSTAAVLVVSNLLVSLLGKIVPKQIRIASYIVVIAGFVTIVEMVLKAYAPALSKSLGLFVPLLAVNCLVFSRAEAFASKNGPLESVLDGLFMGLGFALALFMLSVLREIVGSGTFFGIHIFSPEYGAGMFVSPPGAFILLGILIAAFRTAAAFAAKIAKKSKGGEL